MVGIESVQMGSRARITLQGIINEQGAKEFKKLVGALNFDQVREVLIDCRGMQHIGSAGIGKMLLLYKKIACTGGSLSVVNLVGQNFDLFCELKLNSLFTITRAH